MSQIIKNNLYNIKNIRKRKNTFEQKETHCI